MIEKRSLGKSDIKVAPLAFGGNVFGWTIDEARSFQVLDAFVDAGFNLIDTADVYSRWVPGNQGGESEMIIGKWMKIRNNRSKVVIATKLGMEMGPSLKGLSKSYMAKAVESSLKRLQTDYIDLYQAHRDDETVPLEETLDAFTGLIRAGKVKVIGASNYTGRRLIEALQISERHGLASYVTIQPRYNLYDRAEFENDLEPLCLEKNIGVINYYSLASGFLTGKYRSKQDLSKSARGGRVEDYMNDRGMRILKALDQVAESNRTSQATVALAWLMNRKSVTAPIASATSVEQLHDLTKAVQLKLSAKDIETLNQASAGK